MPDEATQARQRLTHMPFAKWCKECIEHRARPDLHERTDGVKRASIPEVSFDFSFTRARDSETKSARAVCWLVSIDSQTGFIHVVPVGNKGQFRLIVQELMIGLSVSCCGAQQSLIGVTMNPQQYKSSKC